MVKVASRISDEQILRWVSDRSAGASVTAIARFDGVTIQRVVTATTGVMRADISESGEPSGRVRAAYWSEA